MPPRNAASIRQPSSASNTPSNAGTKGPQANKVAKQPGRDFEIKPVIAFYIFFGVHLISAFNSPIHDCDEVYNYWEPTHYLLHGYGLQTWEYAPTYAIRSWLYAGLHAVLVLPSWLFLSSKRAEFFFLRCVLAAICAGCETKLFHTVQQTFNPRVAILLMLVLTSSAGMFHASVAYLPSSFAMYTTMLGMASFMNWRGGLRTAQGITWFALGGIVGWPFAMLLVVPFLLEEILLGIVSDTKFDAFMRFVYGTTRSVIILFVEVCIDSFFFKRFVCVPFNIVWYNIFSGSGKGPDIFGTEPWHFYLHNLALNFNIWLVLALLALPLTLLQRTIGHHAASRLSFLRGLVFVTPFYLWLGVMSLQPHKEERFMYPAYPALALNAAISLHVILALVGNSTPGHLMARIPASFKLVCALLLVVGAMDLSAWRIVGNVTGYGAPLSLYKPLQEKGVTQPGNTVCLGKEWYRFPSSFHLPPQVRAKFIRSEFRGLLPGSFSEAAIGFGLFPGAWLEPSGMNDQNIEDPGKYVDLRQCDFLVDSRMPSASPTPLEPDFIADKATWNTLTCLPFLDAAGTGSISRIGWLPTIDAVPERYRRHWGEYCLLQRRKR